MRRDYIFLCLFSLNLLVVCYSDQRSPLSYSQYFSHSSLSNELQRKRSPPPRQSPPPPLHRSPPPPLQPPPPPPKFDYLMLVETWPPAFCIHTPMCRNYIPSKFTIQGMWPTKKMGPQPHDCDPNQKFNPDDLSLLDPQLVCEWPDLYSNSYFERHFTWSYQWTKQGTCSGMKINDYFELALKVYNTYDLTSILEKEGITPNDKISIKKERIVNAIHKRIGVYPQLSCVCQSKKFYLAEIRLCFTVSGDNKVKYQSCDSKYTEFCDASEDIYYIPIKGK